MSQEIQYCSQHIYGDQEMEELSKRNLQEFALYIQLFFQGISTEGIYHFSKGKWGRLISINADGDIIGNLGCKYLSRVSLPSIANIRLGNCEFDVAGALHLFKGLWKTLKQIDLSCYSGQKNIGQGYNVFIRANWMQLQQIHLPALWININQISKQFLFFEQKELAIYIVNGYMRSPQIQKLMLAKLHKN